MHYREARAEDLGAIRKLYEAVAAKGGGIARNAEEITEQYVHDFLTRSIDSGLIIVGEHPDNPKELICELHAFRKGIEVFRHVLTELTVVVHPDHQGKKLGRTLFAIFLTEISRHHPGIGKVELMARESNRRAIALYQSLGFMIEGRLEMRVRNADGSYEADIPMGWQNPNFEF